jgi:prephenate dehydratase
VRFDLLNQQLFLKSLKSLKGGNALTVWYGAQYNDEVAVVPRIFVFSWSILKVMQIAIQGEPGSFSHEAALKLEPQATIHPYPVSGEVFRAVMESRVDAAVIPIENSLAGSVAEHYDLLLHHNVLIERETLLRIRHNLIAIPGTAIDNIRRVFSHPVALAQCRRFFAERPGVEAVPFYDTAGSVKHLIATKEQDAAGIASAAAAQVYGGEILAAGIEDNPANYTRFFLIRRSEFVTPSTEATKVSLAFTLENKPGTLVSALKAFAQQETNLTKIESRPVPGRPWEYVFYVDFSLNAPAEIEPVLEALRKQCSMVKELGRYLDLPRI